MEASQFVVDLANSEGYKGKHATDLFLFPAPAGPSIAILKCFIVSDLLLKFDFAAGRPARGPGDLKVIPSGHRVQIQDLPGKIQTLHQL